ncbi:hypothetical protein ACJ41O_011859 [Fusarium nematophilum]
MAKTVLVLGATGTQGGSVAKLLVQHPEEYRVRCLTRNPDSPKAKALAALGADLVKADLTVPSTLPPAFKGVWGVFAVTDFYDTAVLDDPMSEEKQGQHIVEASVEAGVECFLWSTLPSSHEISGGKFVTRLYEVTSLYVEKDLSAVCKALFDQWDSKSASLDGKYFLASGARETMGQINAVLEKVSGKKVVYKVKPTCGIPDRDIMLQLYNGVGMYPGVKIPTPEVLDLGVKLHTAEDYIRERLLPHLGLEPQN